VWGDLVCWAPLRLHRILTKALAGDAPITRRWTWQVRDNSTPFFLHSTIHSPSCPSFVYFWLGHSIEPWPQNTVTAMSSRP
jgi:hypothetical protein